MVQQMQEIVAQYEERMREMQLMPMLSYGRRLLRRDGAPNRTFLTSLFIRHELRCVSRSRLAGLPAQHCQS